MNENHFLHALNYCMLLPGPEAQQLATYAGWRLHGTRGGIVAGVLFVLPSAVILWALSWAYVTLGDVPGVVAVLSGLKPVVLAIIAAAVIRIGRKVLKNAWLFALAAGAFLALAVFAAPFPAVVFGAALLGGLGGRFAPGKFAVLESPALPADDIPTAVARPSIWRAVKVLLTCGALWWGPVLAVGALLGWHSIFFQQGVFFSKTALVTFGGAYAVLPYVSQQAVTHYGWLKTTQMLDGLGLAETTPGPLIMVLQFVGFVGAWHQPGVLSPLAAATLGAAITTWATFAPCFLWIFLGAPYVERLREHRGLNATLSAVTSAVVGVILNLAVWFGWHILRPEAGRIDWLALALATLAFLGLVRWKWEVIPVVLGGALAGLARYFFVG